MDKISFFETLLYHGIDPSIVCFDDYVSDDVFCVNNNHHIIEVFYRERGNIFGLHKFKSQSQALEYLLKQLLQISGITTDQSGDGSMCSLENDN